jgi:hypothetical protein
MIRARIAKLILVLAVRASRIMVQAATTAADALTVIDC